MTKLTEDLERLRDRILAADPEDRLRYQPRIAALIAEMDAAGAPVPTGIRDLCDDLANDAIEAQFDNMPV